jgi:hypothetical protein
MHARLIAVVSGWLLIAVTGRLLRLLIISARLTGLLIALRRCGWSNRLTSRLECIATNGAVEQALRNLTVTIYAFHNF